MTNTKVKKFLPVFVFVSVLIAGAMVLILTFQFTNKYSKHLDEAEECYQVGPTHEMIISDKAIEPNHLDVSLCDKLTITNGSKKLRLVAFGERDEHKSYNGISERTLGRNESLQVELNRAGTFNFHDHLDESFGASFTVNKVE